jgi:hypothetical protein
MHSKLKDLETRVVACIQESYSIQKCVAIKSDRSAYSHGAQRCEVVE